MDNKNNCIICGAELEYFNSPKTIECELCHRIFQTNARSEERPLYMR